MLPFTYMVLIDNEKDKRLFRKVYDSNRAMLLAYANKILKDKALAEDAVAEAFLRLAKNFQKVHNFEVSRIAAYTVIIVRNVCYDMNKANEKENKFIDEISDSDADRIIENVVEKQLLNSAVSDLPDIYKDAIILRYYFGLSVSDISEQLVISYSGTKKRLSVAIKLLRKKMNENE